MTFTIITKHGEKTFANKELVTISSKEGCDCRINFGFDYMLTIEFNKNTGKYSILNQFNFSPKEILHDRTKKQEFERLF